MRRQTVRKVPWGKKIMHPSEGYGPFPALRSIQKLSLFAATSPMSRPQRRERAHVGRLNTPTVAADMAAMMTATTACSVRPSSGVAARPNARFAASGFYGNASAFSRVGSGNRAGQRGALVVQMAASKEKKARDLSLLKGMLEKEETMLVAGFRYEGLPVRLPSDPSRRRRSPGSRRASRLPSRARRGTRAAQRSPRDAPGRRRGPAKRPAVGEARASLGGLGPSFVPRTSPGLGSSSGRHHRRQRAAADRQKPRALGPGLQPRQLDLRIRPRSPLSFPCRSHSLTPPSAIATLRTCRLRR